MLIYLLYQQGIGGINNNQNRKKKQAPSSFLDGSPPTRIKVGFSAILFNSFFTKHGKISRLLSHFANYSGFN